MSLLTAESITKIFPSALSHKGFEAIDDVTIRLEKGESVGIVGESGSGKTTLASIVGALEKPTLGKVRYRDRDIEGLSKDEWKVFRRSVQYIFQDPKASMNPFFTLYSVLAEPLIINYPSLSKKEINAKILDMAEKLALPSDILERYPYEVSGGEAQRIAIARALLVEPEIIIADECVSSLDLSVQAQIINILIHVRKNTGASFLFISHDIDLVRYFSDRIYVMSDGRIVEELFPDDIPEKVKSPYTKMLLGVDDGT